ncbi:hypothetical protein DSM03_11142 [Leeuwenhoekiella aestuarii]|uniref:alpha/beta hydrolase family protein n=1 Tax=Leeuwenhoekiella aestuarii TaxID=2249426 RepID=UPI000FFF45FD|nr:alpha/beta hydrolase [Leeuwenhoekiella aestuarii]RXG12168.1 hypothetical protein DSM03_11142 [Leeuwenhoekiella aestuarii]
MKLIIATLLFVLTALVIALSAQNLEGTWQADLEVQPGKTLLFIFHITEKDEKLITTIDIPSQGLKELEPLATRVTPNDFVIDGSNLGFKFNGIWDQQANTITGTFQEGLKSKPLILIKKDAVEPVATPKRPQEPSKPYPYAVEEVTIYNADAKVNLAASLTLPVNPNADRTVVILISGSGPQDRDETYMGHKPFLVLSDYLTRKGIAVLRFDERGVGASTGDFNKATTADFADDVRHLVTYLKNRTDLDFQNIGLIGHSEGAIIAPKVANSTKAVSFVIMLAGTGMTGKQVSLQQALDLRNFAVDEEENYKAYVERAIAIASSGREEDEIKTELRAFYQNSEVLASLLPQHLDKAAFIENLVSSRTNPWIRNFYKYNPADELLKITVPVLALYGSKDTQVPPKYHLQPVKEALENSKSKNNQVVLIPELNHLFQESETGQIAEYPQIEQTISPIVLEKISRWILNEI